MHIDEREMTIEESAKDTAREILRQGRSVRLKLDGMSMWPVLLPGDVAVVKQLDVEQWEKGIVLVFDAGQKWIAHRLMSVSPSGVIMQGDSIPRSDGQIHPHQILGVVVTVFRQNREIQLYRGWRAMLSKSMLLFRPLPQITMRYAIRVGRIFW